MKAYCWQKLDTSGPVGARLHNSRLMGAVGNRRTLAADAVAGAAAGPAWSFGPFLLQERQRQLLVDGVPVHQGSRAFNLLLPYLSP